MADTKQIKVGDRTFGILFPDLLRPLDPEERQQLRDSIRANGVAVPIVVDEHDGVIDGGHRTTLSAELGLAGIPVVVRSGLTHKQKRDLALSLNLHRRHMTREEKIQA